MRMSDNPMVPLNHAIAVAMVHGPRGRARAAGRASTRDPRIAGHHRLDAVRAHLLEMAGDQQAACAAYLEAARRANIVPQQRYLYARAERLRER